MTRGAVVLRPEPGNRRTADRLLAVGLETVRMPLFAVAPVAWTLPDVEAFDGLLLTSANAVRHGGWGLDRVRHLPVIAVGAETAAAATAAGFHVAHTGRAEIASVLAMPEVRGQRMLHLAGRDRAAAVGVASVTVYASEATPIACGAMGCCEDRVVLLHSARAAQVFGVLATRDAIDRSRVRIAVLSGAVLEAAGKGWDRAEAASAPIDTALVALARMLAD